MKVMLRDVFGLVISKDFGTDCNKKMWLKIQLGSQTWWLADSSIFCWSSALLKKMGHDSVHDNVKIQEKRFVFSHINMSDNFCMWSCQNLHVTKRKKRLVFCYMNMSDSILNNNESFLQLFHIEWSKKVPLPPHLLLREHLSLWSYVVEIWIFQIYQIIRFFYYYGGRKALTFSGQTILSSLLITLMTVLLICNLNALVVQIVAPTLAQLNIGPPSSL